MKSFILAVGIAFSLVACSTQDNTSQPSNGVAHSKDSSKTVVEAKYVCPMGKECGFSDKPGKCSSCGSELIEAASAKAQPTNK